MVKTTPFSILISTFFIGLFTIAELRAEGLFDSYQLDGHKGDYLVIKKNVNIRARPNSNGKRLGKLKRRQTVQVLGQAKGTQWLAVRQNSQDKGFVFVSSLTPLINASLEAPLQGDIFIKNDPPVACRYQINDAGRVVEDQTIFIAVDYLGHFQCDMNDESFKFDAMIFMSEVPYNLGAKPIYQITLDLPEIAIGYEDFLSMTVLFDQTKQQVDFDTISLKRFKAKGFDTVAPATDVKTALTSALTLQLQSLNNLAWQTIAGKIPSPGVENPDP